MTTGARMKRFASFSSLNVPGSLSSARQTLAEGFARFALKQDEPPRHELLMVWHAWSGLQHQLELGLTGVRARRGCWQTPSGG